MGDDDPAIDTVGRWASEKHDYLARYIEITGGTRAKYLGPGKAGAAYIDLFCASGRARVRETGELIDGSAVVAWKASLNSGAPFSKVLIADLDEGKRSACLRRFTRGSRNGLMHLA